MGSSSTTRSVCRRRAPSAYPLSLSRLEEGDDQSLSVQVITSNTAAYQPAERRGPPTLEIAGGRLAARASEENPRARMIAAASPTLAVRRSGGALRAVSDGNRAVFIA